MSEQHIPKYRPKVGDTVRIVGRTETYGVVDVSDPSLVTLVSAQGKQFRVGYQALEKLERSA